MHFLALPRLRGKKRVAVGISSAIIFVLFGLYAGAYTHFLLEYFLVPLGIMKLPEFAGISLAAIIASLPFGAALYISYVCLMVRSEPTPSSTDRFLKQITELDNARANLSRAIKYLDDMKQEISANQQKQEELNNIVRKLESASKESAAELRAKLEAIGIVTKRREASKILAGFLLGILASLIATAIWTVSQSVLRN